MCMSIFSSSLRWSTTHVHIVHLSSQSIDSILRYSFVAWKRGDRCSLLVRLLVLLSELRLSILLMWVGVVAIWICPVLRHGDESTRSYFVVRILRSSFDRMSTESDIEGFECM